MRVIPNLLELWFPTRQQFLYASSAHSREVEMPTGVSSRRRSASARPQLPVVGLSVLLLIALLLAGLFFPKASVTQEKTVTVNTTSLVVDGNTTTVTTLLASPGADGKISFPEALAAVNETGPGHTIKFYLPHGATIQLDHTYILRAPNTIIDGDVDGDDAPDVVIDGPGEDYYYSLSIRSSGNEIRNLAFTGFDLTGSMASHNWIHNCAIGTDVDGVQARSNEGNGISIDSGAHDNTIEDNVIAGNGWTDPQWYGAGVRISDLAHDNVIRGNLIGINSHGDRLGNDAGIYVQGGAYQNIIGGDRSAIACEGYCNVISNSSKDAGMAIWGAGTISNVVEGNYIGLDRTGSKTMSNRFDGIFVGWNASQNTIGGKRASTSCDGPCNVISGNEENGVSLWGGGTISNVVEGNYIGVGPAMGSTGVYILPNGFAGVDVGYGASQNTIGGKRTSTDCKGPCNIISGNTGNGVSVWGSGAISNVVQGNFIGVDTTGLLRRPNGADGVVVDSYISSSSTGATQYSSVDQRGSASQREVLAPGRYEQAREGAPRLHSTRQLSPQATDGAAGTVIGGSALFEGNVISANAGDGIKIQGPGSRHTSVIGNYIGTSSTGTYPGLGNAGWGIAILNASDNQIGPGNTISRNELGGVTINASAAISPTDPAHHNSVRGNEIHHNTDGLGIDLQPDADVGVLPEGANDGLRSPAFSARMPGDTSRIWQGIAEAPNGSRVDLFAGLGQTHVGSASVVGERFFYAAQPTDPDPMPTPMLATVTDPYSNTSEFSGEGMLYLSSSTALPGNRIFAFGVLTNTWLQQPITSTKAVTVTVGGEKFALNNKGEDGDLEEHDLYFSGWFTAPVFTGSYSVTLSMNRVGIVAVPLQVIDDPQVAILTDVQELWNEFKRTDKADSPNFHDALRRLTKYAQDHRGVLLDAKQQITPYRNYVYTNGFDDRRNMGIAIDDYIATLSTYGPGLEYLAIIGDDAVIPFFRRIDPTFVSATECAKANEHCEREYPSEVSGPAGNATLADTAHGNGYILTDVPYASFDASVLVLVKDPRPPDLAVGRIFYRTPRELKEAIDAYEFPIRLDFLAEKAAGLHLANETRPKHQWELEFGRAIVPPVSNIFWPTVDAVGPRQIITGSVPGLFVRFNGKNVKWTAASMQDAIAEAALTILYSHADQFGNTVQSGKGFCAWQSGNHECAHEDLTALPQQPGHLLVNAGCHSGYSVSWAADTGGHKFYTNALSTVALSRQLTYLAPTVYGIGGITFAGTITTSQYHDLLFEEFLDRADRDPTVGMAFRQAQRIYNTKRGVVRWDTTDTYIRYGTVLYGLPTQPIQLAGVVPPPPGSVQLSVAPLAAAQQVSGTLDVVVDTPNFQVVTNADGTVRFELHNTGSLGGTAHYPILPQVMRSYRLPAGATVTSVTLTGQSSTEYPDPVTIEPLTPVHRTSGPIQRTVSLTETYPAEIYWYNTAPMDDGVLLVVGVNPLQYDPATQHATLYTHVTLQVAYDAPDSATTLSGLVVNSGDPVDTGQASLPLQAAINSASGQTLLLTWYILDAGDNTLSSGQREVSLAPGPNTVDFSTDTLGWHPGPMLLTATLGDGITAIDFASTQFTARGRSLFASTDQAFYSTDGKPEVSVWVHDETGAGIAGLVGSFTTTLDGAPISQNMSEIEAGRYQATMSLDGLASGAHELTIDLPGTDDAIASFGIDVTPPEAEVDPLPARSVGLTFPVQWSGSDDWSGIEHYELQYRVGSTGAWTDWMTATGWLDYYPAETTADFGPTSPVEVDLGETYYFRGRAIDNVGNEGAYPGGDGDTWTETVESSGDQLLLPAIMKRW